MRTTGDPLALASDLRRLVQEADPRVGARRRRQPVRQAVGLRGAAPFRGVVLSLFAALALALAATGLYSVLSYNVSERRREMGIRAALGATRGRLVRLVLRQGLGFTIAGLALGLAAAAATSRLMATCSSA